MQTVYINDGIAKDSLSVHYLKLRVKSSYDAGAYQQVLIPGERLMRLGEGYIYYIQPDCSGLL